MPSTFSDSPVPVPSDNRTDATRAEDIKHICRLADSCVERAGRYRLAGEVLAVAAAQTRMTVADILAIDTSKKRDANSVNRMIDEITNHWTDVSHTFAKANA